MKRQRHRRIAVGRRAPAGAPPGTLVAQPDADQTSIEIFGYGPKGHEHKSRCTASDITAAREAWPMVWVDVRGLANTALVKQVGDLFGVHELSLEDVINVHQRPKAEDFETHVFIVLRLPPDSSDAAGEQVSLFVGKDFLLTFQEREGDCFDQVRSRIVSGARIIRNGPDYLAYALIDACIDSYFPHLETLGERLESLEGEVMLSPSPGQVSELHAVKRELLLMRRAIWPAREMVNALLRGESRFIGKKTLVFLRDVYDHTIQLMDIVETYREIASGLVDVYLSSQSTRLNEVMKFLTIIATIFIPLSFLASLWGMNFDREASPFNMPELGWYFGYPLALAFMGGVAVAMIVYFRLKKWL
jgi:magnesium transporter